MPQLDDTPPDVLVERIRELVAELQRQRDSLDALLDRYKAIAHDLEHHVDSLLTKH